MRKAEWHTDSDGTEEGLACGGFWVQSIGKRHEELKGINGFTIRILPKTVATIVTDYGKELFMCSESGEVITSEALFLQIQDSFNFPKECTSVEIEYHRSKVVSIRTECALMEPSKLYNVFEALKFKMAA